MFSRESILVSAGHIVDIQHKSSKEIEEPVLSKVSSHDLALANSDVWKNMRKTVDK